jgi:hypothetical protein
MGPLFHFVHYRIKPRSPRNADLTHFDNPRAHGSFGVAEIAPRRRLRAGGRPLGHGFCIIHRKYYRRLASFAVPKGRQRDGLKAKTGRSVTIFRLMKRTIAR